MSFVRLLSSPVGGREKSLSTHRNLIGVHELQSEIIRLDQIDVIHDLIKKVLAFGFALRGKKKK